MELQEGARVFSLDGEEIGKINRFVLNPVSKRVTHVVVEKGLFFPEDRVVPVDWITSSTAERVSLSQRSTAIQNLPPFEEVHYVQLDDAERRNYPSYAYTPMYYWYPPYGTAATYPYTIYPPVTAAETERNIPDNTVPLKEGADVISAEGSHVGDVERLFADPKTNKATHILISKGLLAKERKLVPVEWVEQVKEDKIQLAVGEKIVDGLPVYEE